MTMRVCWPERTIQSQRWEHSRERLCHKIAGCGVSCAHAKMSGGEARL